MIKIFTDLLEFFNNIEHRSINYILIKKYIMEIIKLLKQEELIIIKENLLNTIYFGNGNDNNV